MMPGERLRIVVADNACAAQMSMRLQCCGESLRERRVARTIPFRRRHLAAPVVALHTPIRTSWWRRIQSRVTPSQPTSRAGGRTGG